MSEVDVMKLACRGCGASLEYSAKDQSLKCQYCGTVTEIPRAEEELPDQPKFVIPLAVEQTQLVDAVYEHLASGDLTPDHLLEHATFTKKERFYVPVFFFTGSYKATWTASFGYDRQEPYTDWETRTENGRTHKVPVTKYRTVTDWRPQNGTDTGEYAVLGYAGERLMSATVPVTQIVENRSGVEIVEFDPSYTSGVETEAFTLPSTDVYERRGNPQVNEIIDASVKAHAQGDRQKDWHWTAKIFDTRTVAGLVPVCHAVYEFEGKSYNVWTSGATTSRLLADKLPVDEGRKTSLYRGWAPAVATGVTAGLAIFNFDAPWSIPLLATAAALIYAFLRKRAIIGHSKELRQSLLASRKAAAVNTAGMTEQEQRQLMQATQRPTKPFLAETSRDGWLIPVVTMVMASMPFIPLLNFQGIPNLSHSESYSASTAVQPQTQVQEAPKSEAQQTQQAPQTPTGSAAPQTSKYPRCAGNPDQAKCEELEAKLEQESQEQRQARAQQVEQQSQAAREAVVAANPPAASQVPVPPHVLSLLRLAGQGNWKAVDEEAQAMLADQQPRPAGDSAARQRANNEGLEALKRDQMKDAVDAFQRAVTADPSNPEARNNYAFALMRSGQANQAMTVLTTLLADAPTRTSAWANLAEAAAPSAKGAAIASLKLAVHFSANRDRSISFLNKTVATTQDAAFKSVVETVLQDVDRVPTAQSDSNTSSQRASTQSTSTPQTSQVDTATRQMLADAQACYSQRQFDCAITNAQNVLRLQPTNAQATQLKQAAEQAQAQALRNIRIN